MDILKKLIIIRPFTIINNKTQGNWFFGFDTDADGEKQNKKKKKEQARTIKIDNELKYPFSLSKDFWKIFVFFFRYSF